VVIDEPLAKVVDDLSKRSSPIPPSSKTQVSALTKDWTIMVYLDGDNNLEDAAIDDINEMEHGGGSSENVNVITLIDRHPAYDSSNGDWTGGRYYKILDDNSLDINSQLLSDLGEVDMADPDTLENFLRFCFNSYPADHYALIIWDHGSGIFGACVDDTTGSDAILYVDEIQSAIKNAANAYGESIDIIAFDCCLMGMIEVAYELRNLCDYFIASEETIPWDGFDYEPIIALVNANSSISAKSFAMGIIDAYSTEYAAEQGTCLSLIDQQQLLKTIPLVKNLVGNLTHAITNYEYSYIIIMFARRNSRIFSDGVFVDFQHFLEMLILNTELPGLEETCEQLLVQLEKIILYNWQHNSFLGTANGLSIFFPITTYQLPTGAMYDYANKTRWFAGLDWSSASGWGEFMRLCYDTYQLIPQNDPSLLTLGEETNEQVLNAYCHEEYSVFNDEEDIYEFQLNIQSGDADLYLAGGATYQLQLFGTSALVNPLQGQNETIRLFLTKGKYYLFIQCNAQATTYTILGQRYQPLEAKVNTTITASGGSSAGDATGNFVQELHHYFSMNLVVDNYTVLLNNSATSAYQIIIYALNWTVLASFTTATLGETISFTFDSLAPMTIIIEVYATEGAGSFSLQILGKVPTESQGFGFALSSLIMFSALFIAFLSFKRRKNH